MVGDGEPAVDSTVAHCTSGFLVVLEKPNRSSFTFTGPYRSLCAGANGGCLSLWGETGPAVGNYPCYTGDDQLWLLNGTAGMSLDVGLNVGWAYQILSGT